MTEMVVLARATDLHLAALVVSLVAEEGGILRLLLLELLSVRGVEHAERLALLGVHLLAFARRHEELCKLELPRAEEARLVCGSRAVLVCCLWHCLCTHSYFSFAGIIDN